MTTVVGFGEFC